MDAKKQEKWAEEVWRFVRDDASQPSRINSFYSERPKYEFIHQWIFNPLNAKIGKNADIVFSKIDALNFSLHDTLRNGIEQLGIPSSEYELVEGRNFPFPVNGYIFKNDNGIIRHRNKLDTVFFRDVKLTYYGKEILFKVYLMKRGGYSCYAYIPYLGAYVCLPKININALLDFMKNSMDKMLEEYEFKRNYYIHFTEHFLHADLKKKINLISAGNTSFTRMWDLFRIEDEIMADYNYEIRKEEKEPQVPIAPTAKYNPEGEVIKPLMKRLLKYADKDEKIEIITDPHYAAGYFITMNESVAYLKMAEDSFDLPVIYFEPYHMNVCVEVIDSWNYIAPRLYYGLKRCELLVKIYKDYCHAFELTPDHLKLWMMENSKENMPPLLSNHSICHDDMSPRWGDELDIKSYFEEICVELKKRGNYIDAKVEDERYIYDYLMSVGGLQIGWSYGFAKQFAVGYPVRDAMIDANKIEYGLNLIKRNKYLKSVDCCDFEELKEAANKGNVDAMISLGCEYLKLFYKEGETDSNKISDAASCFLKAVENCDPRALMKVAYHNLSVMYAKGIGLPQDIKKSRDFAKARDEIVLPIRKSGELNQYVYDYTNGYIEKIESFWSSYSEKSLMIPTVEI